MRLMLGSLDSGLRWSIGRAAVAMALVLGAGTAAAGLLDTSYTQGSAPGTWQVDR